MVFRNEDSEKFRPTNTFIEVKVLARSSSTPSLCSCDFVRQWLSWYFIPICFEESYPNLQARDVIHLTGNHDFSREDIPDLLDNVCRLK